MLAICRLGQLMTSLSDPLQFQYPKQFPVELFRHKEPIAAATGLGGILSRSDNRR